MASAVPNQSAGELDGLDSTGLKAIFRARKAALESGRRFAVTEGSAQVQRLLSLTRLVDHLQLIDTPESALD